MASNDNQIRRVLFKLNELFLEGSDFEDRRWIFDWEDSGTTKQNLENVWNEDRALETLTQAGVIKSRSVENRYQSEQLDAFDFHGKDHLVNPDWHHTDPAHREYEWIRTIDGFNYKSFQRFCELHGFNPSSNGEVVILEIMSGVTPVIRLQDKEYVLPSLAAGSVPQAIIEYAAKHFDSQLSLDELKRNINNTQISSKSANLNQFFRKNPFGKGGILAHFAEISPKGFLLKRQTLLTQTELSLIQKIASTH